MKKNNFKRSELVLFVYDRLDVGISIKEIVAETGISRASAYLLIQDINIYISDFFRYDIEIYKIGNKFYKKINYQRRR